MYREALRYGVFRLSLLALMVHTADVAFLFAADVLFCILLLLLYNAGVSMYRMVCTIVCFQS